MGLTIGAACQIASALPKENAVTRDVNAAKAQLATYAHRPVVFKLTISGIAKVPREDRCALLMPRNVNVNVIGIG
ncbi:MAG: hypothetical protein WCO04_06900 [Pseudomonadota bacterium]